MQDFSHQQKELTYPLTWYFRVDDFPNFPFGGIWTNRSLEGISFRLCNQINICHLQGDPDEPPKWLQPQWLEKGSEKAERTEVCHITYGRLLEILLLFFFWELMWVVWHTWIYVLVTDLFFRKGVRNLACKLRCPEFPVDPVRSNNTGWINVHETHGPGSFCWIPCQLRTQCKGGTAIDRGKPVPNL